MFDESNNPIEATRPESLGEPVVSDPQVSAVSSAEDASGETPASGSDDDMGGLRPIAEANIRSRAPERVVAPVEAAVRSAEVSSAAVEAAGGGEAGEAAPSEGKSEKMDWFILKVQSNREESIRDGLMRRVAIAGLDYYFGTVIVPTEKVTEFKGGKKKVTRRKLYPGYIVVQMEINDDTWFLVRETPGIGDFTGAAGLPTPMLSQEVNRILAKAEEKTDEAPKLKIAFSPGDRVKINEGTFENFEGEVDNIDETNGRVTVMINIFGRSTPVELEYWQIEAI